MYYVILDYYGKKYVDGYVNYNEALGWYHTYLNQGHKVYITKSITPLL